MQRGDVLSVPSSSFIRTGGDSNLDSNLVSSPLNGNEWKHKRVKNTIGGQVRKSGGRGRALKRSYTYAALSAYHSIFGNLLTEEFRAEVRLLEICNFFERFITIIVVVKR